MSSDLRVPLWTVLVISVCSFFLSLWSVYRDPPQDPRVTKLGGLLAEMNSGLIRLADGKKDALEGLVENQENLLQVINEQSALNRDLGFSEGRAAGFVEAANLLASNIDLLPSDRNSWEAVTKDQKFECFSVRYVPESDKEGKLVGILKSRSYAKYRKAVFRLYAQTSSGTPIPCGFTIINLDPNHSRPFVATVSSRQTPNGLLSLALDPDATEVIPQHLD